MTGRWQWGGVVLALAVLFASGCATSRAMHRAEAAVQHGDYDSAVAYYRDALAAEPNRVDLRIALQRTTMRASEAHISRARKLEADNQLAGALAEYRLAADLDQANTMATNKVAELDRRIREQTEAARPQPRINGLRQQAEQNSPIPHLDPRQPVPKMQFTNTAVRDLLKTIFDITGINVTYDAGLDAQLSRPYSLDLQETPLEDVLNQVLAANGLTYKVINPQTVFIYLDNPGNRQKYEDQYVRTFYISHSDPAELIQILNQIIPTNVPVRPAFQVNKSANTIVVRATAPVMQIVDRVIASNDRPKPEVLIEAEILEVDRSFIRQLGVDLNQYSLGFTFSPELAPPNTQSTAGAFPSGPPPFNLNTLSRGTSPADFYVTSPTALVRLLESNSTTRVLAKPSMLGRDGEVMTLALGDLVPIPTTSFSSAGAGGIANIPTTQVSYQAVGVNLVFTPHVTYQDDVVLDAMKLEKSGLGQNIDVGGQSFPTIVSRSASGSLLLRDGESNLIAGLLRDDDRRTLKSLPGLTNLPILRSIFGNSDRDVEQTDVVMIITPHIVRGHDLTPDDLKPVFVGTGQNFGGGTPGLTALDGFGGNDGTATPGGAVRTGTEPAAPAGAARVTVTPPNLSIDGALAAGSGPHTMPISISGAPDIATLSLTLTYNPAIIRTPSVTQGSFMMQGGVVPTFVPRVDASAGRIDIVLSRPPGKTGASQSGLLAAISFTAGQAGTTDIGLSGVATSSTGQPVELSFTPVQVTVK
ncbi:MAG TPA: secretin N-terminal domain-containing protein [Vicinamibacterales bacterium]|jgi:type II secretory pathway component HofQ|nr:secretin N-terminal domain-containing protein [Vicinamibacterales bacterium]